MAEHTLILTKGAAILFRSILSAPEAITTLKDKFAAGALVAGSLDSIPTPPEKDSDAWAKEPWESITITEAQRDAAKKAVEGCITNGAAPAGAHLNSLLLQLGLAE
jgi:selenophosphate synthetase-related protein